MSTQLSHGQAFLDRAPFVYTLLCMDTVSPGSRRKRGLALALSKSGSFRHIAGDKFFVPSQADSSSGYVVDTVEGSCTCPDWETRGGLCKHLWAVRHHRQERGVDEDSVMTETTRISYPQPWAAYNRAQCEEKDTVLVLLRDLCNGIEPLPRGMGRRPMALGDVVYAATMKVFGTLSGRRSSSDVRSYERGGFLRRAPAHNTISKYMEEPRLLPVLKRLVDESAKPLRTVERRFAVDGTGFATQVYVRWFDYQHGEDRRVHRWVKCHAMVGTLTNIVTAVEVTEGTENDSPQFAGLLERTANSGFTVAEVSADKAYLSHANLAAAEAVGAKPYIPFKTNSIPTGSPAWERLYHLYALYREEFRSHYHQRSNVESTFSAIKRKFGPGVRSKSLDAQFNEVLLKCLCHNLSMLVHSIHELGVEPKFWQPPRQEPA